MKKKPSYKKLRRAFLLTLGSHPDMEKCIDAPFVLRVAAELQKKNWSLDGTRNKAGIQG
jgi:hypothetical protein